MNAKSEERPCEGAPQSAPDSDESKHSRRAMGGSKQELRPRRNRRRSYTAKDIGKRTPESIRRAIEAGASTPTTEYHGAWWKWGRTEHPQAYVSADMQRALTNLGPQWSFEVGSMIGRALNREASLVPPAQPDLWLGLGLPRPVEQERLSAEDLWLNDLVRQRTHTRLTERSFVERTLLILRMSSQITDPYARMGLRHALRDSMRLVQEIRTRRREEALDALVDDLLQTAQRVTTEQALPERERKRVMVERRLRENPERSARDIARELGVDHKTVLSIKAKFST